ncbi:nucleotidyltransferase family protein [Patescibacteria group bacterium]|nr:nucleotidyltransferase family protein [Patescibacteria group bacterium]
MKAFILAAGLGTRLRPLTETTPKPLVPVAGKPLLAYHLDHLFQHGITEVRINTHYLSQQMEEFVAEYLSQQPKRLSISTIYEPELLGSAGTIRANQSWLGDDEPFLVIYSDNLTDIDYQKLIDHHKQSNAKVTIASYYEHHPEQKGIIEHNDEFVISNFIEKPQPHQITSNYANAGIYVVDPSILHTISELNHDVLDFGHHVFPFLLKNGDVLQVYQMDETLLDIGNLENYTKAQSLPKQMNFKTKNNDNN